MNDVLRTLELSDQRTRELSKSYSRLFRANLSSPLTTVNDAERVWTNFYSRANPNVADFTNMAQVYNREGQPRKALITLERMKERGIKMDAMAYDTLIKATRLVGDKPEKVLDILATMKDERIRLQPTNYTNVILGLAPSGNVEKAFELVDEMQRMGFEPNVYTYSALARVVGLSEHSGKALEVLEEMRERKVDRNVVFYNALFAGLSQHEANAETVAKLRAEMEKDGVVPNNATFTGLIEMYGRVGDAPNAIRTWKELEQTTAPDSTSFFSLLNALESCADIQTQTTWYEKGVKRGLVPRMQRGILNLTKHDRAAYIAMRFYLKAIQDEFQQEASSVPKRGLILLVTKANMPLSDNMSLFLSAMKELKIGAKYFPERGTITIPRSSLHRELLIRKDLYKKV